MSEGFAPIYTVMDFHECDYCDRPIENDKVFVMPNQGLVCEDCNYQMPWKY